MQRVLLEPAGADPTRQVGLVGWGIQAASGLESTMANRVLGQVLGACEAGSIQNMACKAPLNFKHVRKAFTLGLEVKAAVHDWFWEPSGQTKKEPKKKNMFRNATFKGGLKAAEGGPQ